MAVAQFSFFWAKSINKCISDGLMHVAAWKRRTPESKFTKFGEQISIGQTHNRAKFCNNPTRNVRDICDRKFGLLENVGQSLPNFLGDATPQNP